MEEAGGYYGLPINSVATVSAQYNQGGMWQGSFNDSDTWKWYLDHSGSGGESGAGGNIYYYDVEKIHAYNGNRITEKNFDYSKPFYGYDENGNKLTNGTKFEVISKYTGEKIIPAYIFAQAGTIRAVYKSNQHMSEAECELYGVTYVDKPNNLTQNIKISEEDVNNATTSYGQGIGSGAGNLEKSNGVFLPLSQRSK